MNASGRIVVVGGGVIGLAAAYRIARDRSDPVEVTVIDPASGRGASWAAAGMLAPVSEAVFGEQDLTALNLLAVPAFRALAERLRDDTGTTVALRTEGTLAVAFSADDRAALERLCDYRDSLGCRTERLTGRELRRREPFLAGEVRAGALAVDDLSVDNRQYLQVLRSAVDAAGVTVLTAEVAGLRRGGDRTRGVRLTDGTELDADEVVLCTGAATRSFLDLPVEPVKGQILRLRVPPRLTSSGPLLTHTLRALIRGAEVYLVPRASGEIVVGATSEQQGFDVTVTAGGVYQLLRDAYELLPISSEFEFVEAWAGSRPGTPDNGPIVGRIEPGLLVATGHYRNGILLSALTAEAVGALLAGGPASAEWTPFGPERFGR